MLEQLGASEPIAWVRSEMTEDIPQIARFVFLHQVRSQIISQFTYGRNLTVADQEKTPPSPKEIRTQEKEAYQRLIHAGADPKDLESIALAATYNAMYEFLCLLDRAVPLTAEETEDAPQWFLGETAGRLGEEHWTGRTLDSLHESFGSLYLSDEDSQ